MTLIIENVNEKFLNVYKALASSTDSKLKVKKTAVSRALKEIEKGKIIHCGDFENYKKEMEDSKLPKNKKKNAVQEALDEIERGEVVRYSSFEEFKKDMLQ